MRALLIQKKPAKIGLLMGLGIWTALVVQNLKKQKSICGSALLFVEFDWLPFRITWNFSTLRSFYTRVGKIASIIV